MKKTLSNFIVLVIAALAITSTGCGGGGRGGGGTSEGEENKSPVAITGPNQTVAEGSLVTLDASNSNDPDDGITSYLWEQTGGPSVILSNPSSVKPTFTAPSVGPGGAALTFRLTVTDKGGLKSTATCIVNVTYLNKPPFADAGPDQTVTEGSVVTLDASNSNDPDDGIASYLWEQTEGPSVTLSDASAIKPVFIAPDVSEDGTALKFRLTVTDNGGLKSTATCIINITGTNDPPTAEAGADQTVNEGALVTLDGSGSTDTDDGIASYLWEQTGGPSVTLSNSSAVKPTFIAPSVGFGAALTFRLTVTDNGGLKSSDTCIVNVTNVNKPPVAEAGPDQTAYVGFIVTLDGSASADPDNDDISYQWQQTGGSAVTLTNANTAITQFTVSVAAGSVLSFRLTVTDIWGLQSSDTIAVTVQENPKKPAQTALYTAYAGIGYGRADYTTTDDDEFLYNVMLDDLNTITGNLVLDTIFNDPDALAKLLRLVLIIPLTTTFNYTYPDTGVACSIKIVPGSLVHGYRAFTGDLSVNFSATGYPWESCLYYGNEGGVDLTANVSGYYKATSNGLEYLFLNSVTITPMTTLKAVYPKGEVRYNLWKIAYKTYYGTVDPTYPDVGSDTPINMKVVPTLITEPASDADFRDYDLSGGFSLNGNAYTFGSSGKSVKYQQVQENGLTFIYISGNLIAPGLTDPVTVSTPAANPVTRNIYGFWNSGQLNFAGLTGASQTVFNSNYSCTFSGGNQIAWTVAGWQNALEP